MPRPRHYRLIILCAMLMVMAGLRPGLAHQVLIVQGSSLEAYQRATNGFNQVFATTSLPGIAAIQTAETLILDPAAATSTTLQSVTRKYQDLQPNLIVAVGSLALESVKDLNLPVIYLMAPDPETICQGRPHITGVKMQTGPEAQLGAIKDTLPAIKKIGLLHNPATSGDFSGLAQTAAARLALSLIEVAAASDLDAIQGLTAKADQGQLDAILLTPDPAIISPPLLEALTLLSLEKRIPLLAFAPKYLEQGAAMVIFTSPEQLGRQAAEMAKRLLTAPGQGASRPEYGKGVTVQTNSRIIQKLDLQVNHPARPDEEKAP